MTFLNSVAMLRVAKEQRTASISYEFQTIPGLAGTLQINLLAEGRSDAAAALAVVLMGIGPVKPAALRSDQRCPPTVAPPPTDLHR